MTHGPHPGRRGRVEPLANPTAHDGTWVGTFGTVNDITLGTLPSWGVMEGTGAYDGWTFVSFTPDQLDPDAVVTGILYAGPPPPWGETLPLVPAE